MQDGLQVLEIYKAWKHRSGNSVGGPEPKVIPLRSASKPASIVDAQTRLGDKLPAALTIVFDSSMSQSELATNLPVMVQNEKDRTADHVLKFESEQVKLTAKILC